MAAAALRSISTAASRRLLHLSRLTYSSLSYSPASNAAAAARLYPAASHGSLPGRTAFWGLNLRRLYSTDVSHLPTVTDPDIESALKDLMAMNWDELPESVADSVKKALSKSTDDKAGQEVLANVYRAAVASIDFIGVLVSLRMALDDLSGLTGENVDRLPEDLEEAMKAAYKRYAAYLDSFGPDEWFLRKKVEMELGTKMIHLKMRCSGIGSEWGKVTLLGTSGLSGSYVEQRA